MLKFITLLLSILLVQNIFCAEENKDKSTAIESQKVNEDQSAILKIPKVKDIHDQCDKELPNSSPAEVSDCVWKKVSADENLKNQVLDEMKKIQTKKTNDGEKRDLTLTSTVITSSYNNNPGFEKLKKIVGEKIDKTLYGDKKNTNEIVAVDHSLYNSIYKAEISKGIIDALSAYCLHVNYFSDPTKNELCTREKKCDELKGSDKSKCEDQCKYYSFDDTEVDDNKNAEINLKSIINVEEDKKIGACILTVPAACTDENHKNQKAKQMACTVDEFVRAARKNLILNDKIVEFYKDVDSKNTTNLQVSNVTSAQKLNVAQAVTVTTTDIENAYKDSNETLAKETNECAQKINDEKCKQLLDTNLEEKKKALSEYNSQVEAEIASLDENLKSPEILKEYLTQNGYSKEEIEKIMSDKNQIAAAKQLIKDKFTQQKRAIVQELSDRIQSTTSSKNDQITAQDESKIQKITKELSKKTETMKNLVLFNNIASSYLKVDRSGDGRSPSSSETNSTFLNQELKDRTDKQAEALKKVNANKLKDADKSDADINQIGFNVDNLKDFLGF